MGGLDAQKGGSSQWRVSNQHGCEFGGVPTVMSKWKTWNLVHHHQHHPLLWRTQDDGKSNISDCGTKRYLAKSSPPFLHYSLLWNSFPQPRYCMWEDCSCQLAQIESCLFVKFVATMEILRMFNCVPYRNSMSSIKAHWNRSYWKVALSRINVQGTVDSAFCIPRNLASLPQEQQQQNPQSQE